MGPEWKKKKNLPPLIRGAARLDRVRNGAHKDKGGEGLTLFCLLHSVEQSDDAGCLMKHARLEKTLVLGKLEKKMATYQSIGCVLLDLSTPKASVIRSPCPAAFSHSACRPTPPCLLTSEECLNGKGIFTWNPFQSRSYTTLSPC